MKYVLVLDVAKSKSMFMLSSDVGEVLLEPTEYTHNKSDFERINSYISKLNITQKPVFFAGFIYFLIFSFLNTY